MRKFTIKLTLGVALFCSNFIYSQTNLATISGYVTDISGNDTLVGALLSISKLNAVSTNLSGFYEIKTSAGKYVLTCSLLGYKTFETNMEVEEGKTLNY